MHTTVPASVPALDMLFSALISLPLLNSSLFNLPHDDVDNLETPYISVQLHPDSPHYYLSHVIMLLVLEFPFYISQNSAPGLPSRHPDRQSTHGLRLRNTHSFYLDPSP